MASPRPRGNPLYFIAFTVLLDVIGFGLILPILPLPGAPFLLAGTLALVCWFAYRATTREPAVAAAADLQGNAA